MNMHTTNYFDTFIAVAEDCQVKNAEMPPAKQPKSVAQLEYEMLINKPYQFTSDDVLYAANGERRGISRQDFFAKGQPCFRSSPLIKRYGWGVHSDKDGKVAMYQMESDGYRKLIGDDTLKQLRGMRSKRLR